MTKKTTPSAPTGADQNAPRAAILAAEGETLSAKDARPHVLVVEDDPSLRRVMATFLGTRYDLRFSPNAEAALNLLGLVPEYAAPTEKPRWTPALIICDIMLPGMNGLCLHQLVQRQARTHHVPFLFISALSPSVRLLPLLREGRDAYLSKPFQLMELDRLVRVMLRRTAPSPQTATA